MHLRSLERFDFASVLLPYNFTMLERQDYRADVERLLEVCAERQVAVQTIKSIARGRWDPEVTRRFSWYEPITDPDAIGRAVRHVLADPRLFLNTTSDARLLPAVVAPALDHDGSFERPDDAEMRADAEELGIRALFDGAELERI
jgi:hypothetical protein